MNGYLDGDEHVRLDLGLYVLGKLPPVERDTVRRHIVECEACRTECKQVNAVAELLSEFSEDLQSFADDYRISAESTARQNLVLVPPIPVPASAPSPSSASPSASASGQALGRTPRRGVPMRVRLTVAAAALTLVAGVGIGVWSQRGEQAPTGVSVAASDAVTGATLSVSVGARATGSDVRAIVGGLDAGLQFQLIAVSRDGTTRIIHQGIAAGDRQTIVVTVDVAPADLAFFTVARADGSVLVTVRVSESAR